MMMYMNFIHELDNFDREKKVFINKKKIKNKILNCS